MDTHFLRSFASAENRVRIFWAHLTQRSLIIYLAWGDAAKDMIKYKQEQSLRKHKKNEAQNTVGENILALVG